jgi:LL-diaminopimelate aminotransferase
VRFDGIDLRDAIDAGAFLRFSVTYIAKDEAEEDALMAETVKRLTGLKLAF